MGEIAYSFLDPTKEGSKLAGWIIGIGAAGVIIFSLARTLILLRSHIIRCSRLSSSNEYRRRGGDGDGYGEGERLDEWETVEVERPVRVSVSTGKPGRWEGVV